MSVTTIHDKDHKDDKTVKFPWVGIHRDGSVIVLFRNGREGTVIASRDMDYEVGYHCCTWKMPDFKPLPEGEKVTLQNNWELTNAES